eukprot:15340057-Ditylum_brightwellii.AAC.1
MTATLGMRKNLDKYLSVALKDERHGVQFQHWMSHSQLGVLLWPVKRALGSSQDLACSGSEPLYLNSE